MRKQLEGHSLPLTVDSLAVFKSKYEVERRKRKNQAGIGQDKKKGMMIGACRKKI